MRVARPDDVAGICRFGEEHFPAHYAPLIGEEAARDGVGQCGPGHVIYKLHVHPRLRGHRLGPRLIDALSARTDADVVFVEHFAEKERTGAFYEREGSTVQRVETGIVWRSRPLTRP